MTGVSAKSDKFNLFGLDLRAVWHVFRAGWVEALDWPALAWLAPDEPVALRTLSGQVVARSGALSGRTKPAGAARATAIELPIDLVLESLFVLPAILPPDLDKAVRLRAFSLSPFPEQDTALGWRTDRRADGALNVRMIIASRTQITTYLASQSVIGEATEYELWFDAECPIVLQGFAESARAHRRRRRSWAIVASLSVLILLVTALAATPALHARQRADDARAAHARLERQVAPLLAKRERLTQLGQIVTEILAIEARTVAPLPVLDRLTKAIPDDAVVDRLSWEGGTVKVSGQASDAASLLQQLGHTEGFFNTRSSAPIQRNVRTGKENFSIEFDLAEGAGKQ